MGAWRQKAKNWECSILVLGLETPHAFFQPSSDVPHEQDMLDLILVHPLQEVGEDVCRLLDLLLTPVVERQAVVFHADHIVASPARKKDECACTLKEARLRNETTRFANTQSTGGGHPNVAFSTASMPLHQARSPIRSHEKGGDLRHLPIHDDGYGRGVLGHDAVLGWD